MEYKVIRTCYFDGRLFERGEVVVLSDDAAVPEHLEVMTPPAVTKAEPAPKKTAARKRASK